MPRHLRNLTIGGNWLKVEIDASTLLLILTVRLERERNLYRAQQY